MYLQIYFSAISCLCSVSWSAASACIPFLLPLTPWCTMVKFLHLWVKDLSGTEELSPHNDHYNWQLCRVLKVDCDLVYPFLEHISIPVFDLEYMYLQYKLSSLINHQVGHESICKRINFSFFSLAQSFIPVRFSLVSQCFFFQVVPKQAWQMR